MNGHVKEAISKGVIFILRTILNILYDFSALKVIFSVSLRIDFKSHLSLESLESIESLGSTWSPWSFVV